MYVYLRILVFSGLFLIFSGSFFGLAHADEDSHPKWKEGRLRLELAGYAGLNSASESRSGDINVVGSIEYEGALSQRLTLGVKFSPLFYYHQDPAGEPDIWGASIGPELRFYTKRGEYRGFFGEAGTAVLATAEKFEENSGSINFIVEFGAGYEFKSGWHVAVKFRHLSNLFLASSNAGADGVGFGLGYSF